LAAELIAGFSRGSKHWTFADREKSFEYVGPLLKNALKNCSQSAVIDWQSCLRFCVYDLDIRRTKWLTDILVDNLNLEFGSSAQRAKSLHFLYPVMSEYSWRNKKLISQVTNYLTKYLAYPYQQVRDMIATTLTLMFRYNWNPPRNPDTQLPVLLNAYEQDPEMLQFLKLIQHKFTELKAQDQVQKKHAASVEQPSEETEAKALSKTIIHWLSYLLRSGGTHVLYGYLQQLVPLLISIYETPDQDLEDASRKAMITLASSMFPQQIAEQLLGLIHFLTENATSQQEEGHWKVRAGVLSFIQIFGYRHQFYILQEGKQDALFQTVKKLLRDKTLEVREAACDTLSGFIKIANEKKLKELIQFFCKIAKENLPKSTGPMPKDEKAKQEWKHQQNEMREKAHFAVLGLSAIIRAYPYDVPDFLPPILVQLTNYFYRKNVGQQVTNTVKKTFGDFMKYHKDTWHLQKSPSP
jgi:proteasome activator subunit 4